jgi:hypothetical protein
MLCLFSTGDFSYNKPSRCTNFSNLFWNESLHVSYSSSVHHQEFFTVHTAVVNVIQVCWQLASRIGMFHPDPACKLSADLYDIYHCCVYSKKLLMMDRGTVRNMKTFILKWIWEIGASNCFIIRNLSCCTVTWTANSMRVVGSIIFSVLLIFSNANNVLVVGNMRVGQKSKFTGLIISHLKTCIGCDCMREICRRAIFFIFKCRSNFLAATNSEMMTRWKQLSYGGW